MAAPLGLQSGQRFKVTFVVQKEDTENDYHTARWAVPNNICAFVWV